ncbi:unnamed protein product [Rotaria sp. Silwood1]|nr:unnamed protein product [Rotaria sp. Silwood1]
MKPNIFDRLQNDTDRIWKFQRYSLICEYLSRPSIPPPFIIVAHHWRLILTTLSQDNVLGYLRCSMDGMKMVGSERIKVLERRRLDAEESIDETIGPSDQSRRGLRRDSIIANTHRTSIAPEISQVSSMNFFRSLKM